jgi:hypothetical protein
MFLIDSEILCNPKITDEEEIRVDSDFTQLPIDDDKIRIKLAVPDNKFYEDYTVRHFNGVEGEHIGYYNYFEEPEVKKITSDELYKYYP